MSSPSPLTGLVHGLGATAGVWGAEVAEDLAAAIVRADHSAVRRKVESVGLPSVNHGVGRDEEELDLVAEPHAARLLDHVFLIAALDVTPPGLALFHLLEMPSLHSRAHIAQLQLWRRLRAPLFENSTHGLHVLLEEVGW